MPRSSSRSGGGPRRSSPFGQAGSAPKHSAPAPVRAAPSPPPPPPPVHSAHAPPPTHAPPSPPPAAPAAGGGMMSNMMGSMASGVASGVGFGVAQRALDSIMGPRKTEVVHTQDNSATQTTPSVQTAGGGGGASGCSQHQEDLSQCLRRHTDSSLCQNYVDSLKTCEANVKLA
eukprot:GHVS01010105.1.p1 GENE.GHVS01010105.1~~GHVS01010105.1.p1  ORF type:complete len:183 (-),score=40.25 GHVS01010105.1:362-880(-)